MLLTRFQINHIIHIYYWSPGVVIIIHSGILSIITNNYIVTFSFFFEQANVRTDAILWGRLPAGRRAATGSRLGRKTHPRSPIPKTVAVTFVINGLIHSTTDHGQTGWRHQCQQVASRQTIGKLTQEEFTTVVRVQQPEIYDDHGPWTYCVYARRAIYQGKSTYGISRKLFLFLIIAASKVTHLKFKR